MLELASILHKERGFDVHLFALEHRYYGSSYPPVVVVPTNTDDDGGDDDGGGVISLPLLSSRQALADLAYFVHHMNDLYNLDNNHNTPRWITFGGSYPGMLAAWARLKYPHLIYASISNSAPIQTTLDFLRYNDVVGYSIRNVDVGGSEECYDVVVKGHEDVSLLLSPNDGEDGYGRDLVANLFDVCGGGEVLMVERNVQVFLGDGVVDLPVQGNDPSCEEDLCNIEKICTFLTTSDDPPIQILATLSKRQSPNSCKNIDYSSLLTFLSSPQAIHEGTHSWLWQTCTEMGFYQTCHLNSTCPYGRGYHTLNLDLEICQMIFGLSAEEVARNVEDTLDTYGGWDMEGTRILSVNGDIDPWSALSMNVKSDDDWRSPSSSSSSSYDGGGGGYARRTALPTYWSKGASHHFWTHEVSSSDGIDIMQTRENIYSWVIDLIDAEMKVEKDGQNLVGGGGYKHLLDRIGMTDVL